MARTPKVPNAWDDDDWETQADRAAEEGEQSALKPPATVPVNRAERLVQHTESQRKLWQEADTTPETNYIALTHTVPLASTFKPSVKVLARQPESSLRDDDDNQNRDNTHPSAGEIQARLEEKKRKYDEARAKIFGNEGSVSRLSSPNGKGRAGRGRGRGEIHNRTAYISRQDSQSPRVQQLGELCDPNYEPKPTAIARQSETTSPRPDDDKAIRAPRGPDPSGRGGFGPVNRGGTY